MEDNVNATGWRTWEEGVAAAIYSGVMAGLVPAIHAFPDARL
jgi:hypothetical protein